MTDDKPREFYVHHSAINAMSKYHHIITNYEWHLKEDSTALNNIKEWIRVIDYKAFDNLKKENEVLERKLKLAIEQRNQFIMDHPLYEKHDIEYYDKELEKIK